MYKRQLSDYVDYRTYLDYDIKVTNQVTGQQAYLSRVSRDSSGGENQAPFYAVSYTHLASTQSCQLSSSTFSSSQKMRASGSMPRLFSSCLLYTSRCV